MIVASTFDALGRPSGRGDAHRQGNSKMKTLLKKTKMGTLALALALSPVAYGASVQRADAFVVAFLVATPTIWAVRVLLSPRRAY